MNQKPKTLLITGFEPFGGEKDNPSWEVAKRLDGERIGEYEIVSRQLEVVWGRPKKQLVEFVAELRPDVVVSIGQGRPEGFRLETHARNERGDGRDNNGEQAPVNAIFIGGEDVYKQPLAVKLVDELKKEGFPVSISIDAGKYLCEECFYSLLHLKETGPQKMEALFVHIPRDGVELLSEDVVITLEYAEQFIRSIISKL